MLFYVVNTSARVSGSRSPHCKYDHLHPSMYECMPARADLPESSRLAKADSAIVDFKQTTWKLFCMHTPCGVSMAPCLVPCPCYDWRADSFACCGISDFKKILQCIARFGDELHLQATHEGVRPLLNLELPPRN